MRNADEQHPKSSSEVKNDWLVIAMHATAGSRNAECGIRSAKCGAWNEARQGARNE